MRQTLPPLQKVTSAQGFGLFKSDFNTACGFGIDSVTSLSAAATEIRDACQRKPVNDTENDWQQGTPAPPARIIAQGPPPGIPRDSTLEVIGQFESMNLR
uniref:Uncharacterized protein n=1 Tax=Romanomermis culicivorax TaxID=13658 RepID=A0A915KML1_ROMCU